MSEEASSETRYAEQMFPVPVDHGTAQPDRAVSTGYYRPQRPSNRLRGERGTR